MFVGDKVPSLLAVAGDDGAGHGQFYPEIRFDGSIDNRVKAEDLLEDPGVHVMRRLGTSKEEGFGLGAVAQNDLCKDARLTIRSRFSLRSSS